MRKILLSLSFLSLALGAAAQTAVELDGLKYSIENGRATVAKQKRGLSGRCEIPATITVGGTAVLSLRGATGVLVVSTAGRSVKLTVR